MISRTINIRKHMGTATGDTWGVISGVTEYGVIEYYSGQTISNAYIAEIPIFLCNTIDDIGFYTPISNESHVSTHHLNNNQHVVTYTGETMIGEFRRYGKVDSDGDLYNPTWNSGFTYTITNPNGVSMKIINEKEKSDGFDKQNLYDYKIWASGDTGTTITYSDIDNKTSVISYNARGLTDKNSISLPSVKLDYLIGVISEPKINNNVFIDRGNNSSFDKHMRLGDVKSLTDLENYGNGYFKIKEN